MHFWMFVESIVSTSVSPENIGIGNAPLKNFPALYCAYQSGFCFLNVSDSQFAVSAKTGGDGVLGRRVRLPDADVGCRRVDTAGVVDHALRSVVGNPPPAVRVGDPLEDIDVIRIKTGLENEPGGVRLVELDHVRL